MSILPQPIPDDPSMQLVPCAICGTVKPMAESYGVKAMYAHAPGRLGSFECPAIMHWCCTAEHAEQAGQACIAEHLAPLLRQKQAEMATAQAEQARASDGAA